MQILKDAAAKAAQGTADVARGSFSLEGFWRRSVRVVITALGVLQTLGHMPNNTPEWCGFGIAVLGSGLTIKNGNGSAAAEEGK